jgi:hypothetical protein
MEEADVPDTKESFPFTAVKREGLRSALDSSDSWSLTIDAVATAVMVQAAVVQVQCETDDYCPLIEAFNYRHLVSST